MSSTEGSELSRLRTALGVYSRMVLHLDVDGRVLWLNDAARKRLREEALLRPVEGELLPSLTPSLRQGPLASVLRSAHETGLQRRFQQSFPSGLLVDFTVLPADGEFLLLADDLSSSAMQMGPASHLTAVLEASQSVMWIYDPKHDTVATWSSDAEMGDSERVELPWQKAAAGLSEVERALIREGQRATLESGVPFDVSYSLGSGLMVRRYQSRGARVLLDGRQHLVGMSIDVTGLQSSERAAQVTHQRFLRASEALGLGLWEIDMASGRADLSSVTQKLFGVHGRLLSLQDVELDELVHPDDVGPLLENWSSCVDEGGRYEVSFRVRGKVSEPWRWVHSVGERISGQGAQAKVAGWTRDVTQERQLQALHEVSEQVALVGGWLIDVATREVFWTAGTYRLLGRDAGQQAPVRGDISELHAPEEREGVKELFRRAVEHGEPFSYDATLLRGDGARRRVHVRGEPELQDGVVVQVVGAIQDITDREALETELRRSQRLDSLGRMAGGVAHDFNNVLAAISGNAELIRGASSLLQTQDLADEVLLATSRGKALTRQMMSFARDGYSQPGERGTEVVAATEQVVGMLQRLLPADVELEVMLHPRRLHVGLDDGRFEQIVMNLVLNARDALGGSGRISVLVGLESEPTSDADSRKHWVQLEVKDDGAGMSAETQERMFEPFFTTRPGRGGTGLGLATVHRVVTAVGGRLQVHSEVDVGTRIQVHLPLAAPPVQAQSAEVAGRAVPQGRRILIAEDDEVLRRMLVRVFVRLGHQVTDVEDGAAAFAAVGEHGMPDLLITDIDMLGLTGVELSVLLRARSPRLPMVFISSHPESSVPFDDVRVRCFSKPFALDALERAVAELLDLA